MTKSICERILDLRDKVLQQDLPAAEVWLGPTELNELRRAISDHAVVDIVPGWSVPVLYGMKIHLMAEPGIRVGSTIGEH